jgi:hypothetical protein
LRDNPAEMFGKHVYQMEPFHIDAETVNSRFATYLLLHPDIGVDALTPMKKSF